MEYDPDGIKPVGFPERLALKPRQIKDASIESFERPVSSARKKKTSLFISLLVLVSVFHFALVILPPSATATTRYVGGGGPGNFTAIQDAINASLPGDTVYVYNGTYNENPIINKTLNLIGEDKDATVVDGGGNGNVFNITVDWVNISGFTMRNSGSNLGDAGLLLYNVDECNLTDVSAWDNSYGIYLYGSNNNNIYMSNVSNNDYGMNFELSDNNTILNNTASNNSGSFIFGGANGNSIIGNNASFSTFAIWLGRSDNNTVMENSLWDNLYGFEISSSSNNTIAYNEVLLSGWDAMDFEKESHHNTLTGNTLSYGFRGIHLRSSAERNTVIDNTISANQIVGILIRTTNNTFTGNTLVGNGFHFFDESMTTHSLEVWNSHSIDETNTVNGKPVRYWKDVIGGTIPSDAGQVLLANCSDVIVENQSIGNASVAIDVGFSSNITILNNTVSYNPTGAYLRYSDNSTVLDNDFVGNTGHGIFLDSSNDNMVFHNNFIANTIHAFDDTKKNRWNDLYPSGGNYWDDYSGPDQFSGPGQNEPGSDGIGDWPHPTDGNRTWDRYPLMYPFEEASHPLPPTILQATLSDNNLQNVTINWTLSHDDEMGLRSVVGYDIFRNASYSRDGVDYQLIASLPNGTSEFIDVTGGEGDPNSYFYQVCAVDVNNVSSCSNNQAAKFTRALSKGPNLVSIPLIQSEETIQTVLQTISYDNAWSYDAINHEWKSFSKSKPYAQSLEYLNHTMGIWVNVTQDSNLTVAGVVPTSTTIDLQTGWNLVGFPSFDDNYTVADLKVAVVVERIEGFDGLAPPYSLKAMIDGDLLQAGFGYWIRVESPTIWSVEDT